MKSAAAYALPVLVLLVGCGGIFASSDVKDPRYFAPAAPARHEAASARPDGASAPLKLRIGRVSSGEHLRQRIVYRASDVEVGEYEDLRWTEKPEEYVRRALLRSLFEERGLTQAVGGAVATVDVEVLSFEEVRAGSKRSARVEVSYAVRDDRVVVAANTVRIERPSSGDDMANVVEAMSSALDEASNEIASEIEKALERTAGDKAAKAAPTEASSRPPPSSPR